MWHYGTEKEERRNQKRFGGEHITLKARQASLRWYGYIVEIDGVNKVKQNLKIDASNPRAR